MRKILLSILAAAVLLGPRGVGFAQSPTATLVTVAFSGYDELKANLQFLGKLAGRPDLAQGAEGMLMMMTQGQGLAGLETNKPWGVVVQPRGPAFSVVAFLPVNDLKKLFGALGNLGIEAKDAGNGVFQVSVRTQQFFVQEKGGWAFVAPSAEFLKDTPANPAALLGDLPKNYDLAVRMAVKNVPQAMRQQALVGLQMAAQMAGQRRSDESDEAYAVRSNVMKQGMQEVVTLLSDLDEVTAGWKIDRQTGTTHLDFAVTALPSTKLAERLAQLAQVKTNFAAFNVPGAALTANWSGVLSDNEMAQLQAQVLNLRTKAAKNLQEQGLGEQELKLSSQVIGDVSDVAQKTIANKKVDAAAALLLKPDAATLVAGGLVVDGAKLQNAIKLLVTEAAKNEPDLAKLVKLDEQTHQSVHLHSFNIPVPNPDAVKFLGPALEVVLGIGDQAVYLAVGRDAAKTLRQVIDQAKAQTGKPTAPLRIVAAATPIAEFIAAATPNAVAAADAHQQQIKQTAAQVAAMLKQSGGTVDHLTITAAPIPNGARMRIEVEQGLLKALPALAPLSPLGPGAPAMPPGGPTSPAPR